MAEKRRFSSLADDEAQPRKRPRITRRLRHIQHKPANVEPAPQDAVFTQSQLLRSITAILTAVGFDSVKPSALEMFRSHTEEYMLRLGTYIRTSMHSGRRTRPVAQDFSMALSLMPNAATASLLKPQLKLSIPESISYPSIPAPDPPPAPAPDFSALLEPLTTTQPPKYIPPHFPALPPQHSWKATPVFPERETDPRKMREKATQEGMLAEQALRKLASAAKAGALKAEKRRSSVLSGPGKVRDAVHRRREDVKDTFADVMKDIGGGDEEGDLSMEVDGAGDADGDGVDVGMPEGVVVNYDMGHWRHSGHRRAMRI
jgi:transcription initiation factor TFIID subunit 8